MSFNICEWKGKKIAVIEEEGQRVPFRFGITKVKLMVKYFEEIKKFVEENK